MPLFRLIEWRAVQPTGLPAGGLPASIARTSPLLAHGTGNREMERAGEWKGRVLKRRAEGRGGMRNGGGEKTERTLA